MRLGADRVLAVGVKDHQISVTAYCDRALARVESEELRGSRGNQFYKSIDAEAASGDAAGINQTHPVLHSRAAVGNFCEVANPHFFLLLEAERAVVGRNYLQVIARQALPQFLLMPFFAKRRCKNIF